MKKILKNICLFSAMLFAFSSCVESEPEYTDFPSKDVDFKYSVAPNAEGVIEYALDYYVVSTIQFTNISEKTGKLTWDFGDGQTSNEANPLHKYEKSGIYQVKLTVDGVGYCSYPVMIYDIAPVLSIKEKSADIITANDVSVDFDIFLPNPEKLKVKYVLTFPEGAMDSEGNEITDAIEIIEENGVANFPSGVRFRNIGSQKVVVRATFDIDREGGENRVLEDSYVNVQVGSPIPAQTIYYAVYGGNIKAYKLIDESLLPEGTKNYPFDMGVKSGTTPMNLVFADGVGEEGQSGTIYILDAGKQYTYVNDEAGVLGDGKITVMNPDGSGVNVFVTNVGQGAFFDPYFGTVDGNNLIYTDRNTGIRKTDLKLRGEKEKNDYLVQNDYLAYYSRSSLGYGAISCTILKDSKDNYWWGKCYNGKGVFRFKAENIGHYLENKELPNKVILNDRNLRSFMIDEDRKGFYVYRSKDAETGFYVYTLPGDFEDVGTPITKISIEADPINSTADEGLFITQMALDKETGNVYFGFNKAKTDNSSYSTGLHYYSPESKKLQAIEVVKDKILGVAINGHKTNLF